MNLQSWFKIVAGAETRAAAGAGFFRQIQADGISSAHRMNLFFVCARGVALLLGLMLTTAVFAQTNYYITNGIEYPVVGHMLGDQVHPDVAISTTNGVVVWQDNVTDGDGWGISAERLDSTLSGTLSTFRVNATGTGDQENPRVALQKNGGAVIVWQGGTEGYQHVFARFLTPSNTFLTSTDLLVSVFTNKTSHQVNPVVAVLNNSNVVMVWESYNQAGSNSLLDVYAKILTPSGGTVTNEFLVNSFTNFNQRTPAVAALSNGGFAVAWVSEQQRSTFSSSIIDQSNGTTNGTFTLASVDVYVRLFQSNGVASTGEILVSSNSLLAANPNVAVATDGSLLVAWSGRDGISTNGWDVYARRFGSTGLGGKTVRLNTYTYGNQFAPRLSVIGLDYLAVWTSLGQDGSREGVYGQFIHNDGTLIGGEFRVNTTTVSQQMQPAIASDGATQFLTLWTSYVGSPNSFDLYAQRYVDRSAVLDAMSAPYVWAPFTLSNGVYQPQLVVSWVPVAGLSVSNYEVYVNGSRSASVTSNVWVMTAANGLTTSSNCSFAVDYVTSSARRSPLSPSTSGATWSGASWGGIPYEWMQAYYGSNTNGWPVVGAKLSGSYTLYQVFLSGGSPLDSSTWLKQSLVKTSQGVFLNWNTQEGTYYQVQVTTNLTTWASYGSPRFAAGTNDSISVGSGTGGYYRVVLLR